MPGKLQCPICNKDANDELAFEYKGIRYGFCCTHCRAQFVEECELEFIQSTVSVNLKEP